MARKSRQSSSEPAAKPAHPFGFAENAQATFVAAPGPLTAADPDPDRVAESGDDLGGRLKVGPGGRVLIPADLRAALGVVEGDTLLATFENGELRLMSTATAVERAQAMVRSYLKPSGRSLVDELIAERRAENARDSE